MASFVVPTVYLSIYILLLVALSIHVYKTEPNLSKTKLLKSVWSKKAIYGAILVHLYDIATDLGVLIHWYNLATIAKNDGKQYKTINISIFWFFLSFFFLFYRIATTTFAVQSACKDGKRGVSLIVRVFLGIFDLYIIKEVIESIKRDETEPGPRQRSTQLAECFLESLPQVVLQTIFIILSYNDDRLRTDSSMTLVMFSLIGSILSIANKYIWFDRSGAHPKAYDSKFQKKMYCYCLSTSTADDITTEHPICAIHKTKPELCDTTSDDTTLPVDSTKQKWCWFCYVVHVPNQTFYHCITTDCDYAVCQSCYEQYKYDYNANECINLYYVLRFAWRFAFLCIRFISLSLICVVIGAVFLFVFVLFSSIYWCCIYWFTVSRYLKTVDEFPPEEVYVYCCILSCVSMIGNAPSSEYAVAIGHWIEMGVCMIVITLFATNDEIECVVCSHPYYRQASHNPYVESFVVLGWIMLSFDVVLYLVILRYRVFAEHSELSAFNGIASGFSYFDS
eukprot:74045_1